MLFLVDGYNVTMGEPLFARLSKEGQRTALLDVAIAHGRSRLGRGEIVAVFDARDAVMRSGDSHGAIKAVYAPDADDEIVRRASAARGGVVVVTGDMRLRARISQDVGRHVRFADAAVLLEERAARPHAGGREIAREDAVSRKTARDITSELEDIWLTDEE